MKDRGVSIAGDGVEIGRLQIHMDSKRTSNIKNQILESRLIDDNSNTGVNKEDTKGWKIVRESLSKKNSRASQLSALKGTNNDMIVQDTNNTNNTISNSEVFPSNRQSTTKIGGLTIQHRGSMTRTPSQISNMRIRNSHLAMRKSNMAMDQNRDRIDEEGASSTMINPFKHDTGQGGPIGWKVLRESIQRKEFTEGLRESSLRLHEMDECALSRRSINKRGSLRNSTANMHPDTRLTRRKSMALENGANYCPSEDSMGYSTVNIATARKASCAGSGTLSGTMQNDIQIMMALRRSPSKGCGCFNFLRPKSNDCED